MRTEAGGTAGSDPSFYFAVNKGVTEDAGLRASPGTAARGFILT